jgi:hypothetical protein
LAQQLAITHTRFPAIPPLLKKPQERPEARETPPRFPVSDLKHARKRQSGPPLRAGSEGGERREPLALNAGGAGGIFVARAGGPGGGTVASVVCCTDVRVEDLGEQSVTSSGFKLIFPDRPDGERFFCQCLGCS